MIKLYHGIFSDLYKYLIVVISITSGISAQFKTPKTDIDQTYRNDTKNVLRNSDLTILAVPIRSIKVSYINNTESSSKKTLPDSFFIDASNQLLQYECSQHFYMGTSFDNVTDLPDSSHNIRDIHYSLLKNDTLLYDTASRVIREIAQRHRVDLILVPYSCKMKNVVFQQQGWRRESPNTARPVKYRAQTEIHLQIWDKEGTLLYEKIARDQTKRPILYTFFKKKSPKEDEDMASFAQRHFAPPLLRSLSEAIKLALDIKGKN